MLSWDRISGLAVLFLLAALAVPLQGQNAEQVQVGPPPLHRAEPPAPGATPEELEKRGDELRTEKNYLDAVDYYEAAIKRGGRSSAILNKIGISQLMLQRYKDARKNFERAIKADRKNADAYNNLGVVYYQERDYKKAIKQYMKAVALSPDAASYYSNMGAAYFARREFDKGTDNYAKALQLDPDIFDRISRAGVQAELPSPEDRARYDYVLAKLYAKMGISDRSLLYLRKAMEEGYKNIGDVYKDSEFTQLRKDPRFVQLMASKPTAIPE